jgi:hypothetical protein
LTFGVAEGFSLADVMKDWTRTVVYDFGGIHLFDLPHGSTIYRVFLLPGCLQVDLSFAPAADFGPIGPRFELLFGRAVEKAQAPTPSVSEILRACGSPCRPRALLHRGADDAGKPSSGLAPPRDLALELACVRRGLDASYGRELDKLPAHVLDGFEETLVPSLERSALLGALAGTISVLLRESADAVDAVAQVEPELRELVRSNLTS